MSVDDGLLWKAMYVSLLTITRHSACHAQKVPRAYFKMMAIHDLDKWQGLPTLSSFGTCRLEESQRESAAAHSHYQTLQERIGRAKLNIVQLIG